MAIAKQSRTRSHSTERGATKDRRRGTICARLGGSGNSGFVEWWSVHLVGIRISWDFRWNRLQFRAFKGLCLENLKREDFRDWVKAYVWKRIFEAVSDEPDMEYAMVDATFVKVHRHTQGAKGELKARP